MLEVLNIDRKSVDGVQLIDSFELLKSNKLDLFYAFVSAYRYGGWTRKFPEIVLLLFYFWPIIISQELLTGNFERWIAICDSQPVWIINWAIEDKPVLYVKITKNQPRACHRSWKGDIDFELETFHLKPRRTAAISLMERTRTKKHLDLVGEFFENANSGNL